MTIKLSSLLNKIYLYKFAKSLEHLKTPMIKYLICCCNLFSKFI